MIGLIPASLVVDIRLSRFVALVSSFVVGRPGDRVWPVLPGQCALLGSWLLGETELGSAEEQPDEG